MKKLIVLLTTFVISLNAHATLLSVELNQNDYQVGDVLTADIVISDIEEDAFGFQKLLASFDLALSWDNAMINYTSASFGSKLDVDPDPMFASDQFTLAMTDSISLSEVSFAFSDDLFFAQDGLDSFILASINFNVIGSGNSNLSFDSFDLGDDFGDSFTMATSMDKSYSVMNNNSVNVPEPSALALMLIALLMLTRQVRARH